MPRLVASLRHLIRGRVQWELARLIRSRSDQRVAGGPFRGMLLPESRYGMTLRFLLGTHEMELHPAIEQLVTAGLGTVINCGAAQGYYAIGFALRCPNARVIAFETDTQRQRDIAVAAAQNGVGDRVVIRGSCDADALRDCLVSARLPVLVLADMEGAESQVFAGEMAARLSQATVVTETHDEMVPGITDRLLEQFAATHRVEIYAPRDRTGDDLPLHVSSARWMLFSSLLVWLVKEYRPPRQRWLLFTPRVG